MNEGSEFAETLNLDNIVFLRDWLYVLLRQDSIHIWYEEGNVWVWDCTQYVPTRPLNNTFPLAWRKSRKKSFSSFVFQQAAHDMNWFEYWQEGKHIIAASLFQHYFDYNQSRSLFQDWNLESGLFEVLYSWGLILVLHTLNRPGCLKRVAPVMLVNRVTVPNLKQPNRK